MKIIYNKERNSLIIDGEGDEVLADIEKHPFLTLEGFFEEGSPRIENITNFHFTNIGKKPEFKQYLNGEKIKV